MFRPWPSSRVLICAIVQLALVATLGCRAKFAQPDFRIPAATMPNAAVGAPSDAALVVVRFPSTVAPGAVDRYRALYRGRGLANLFYDVRDENEKLRWMYDYRGFGSQTAPRHPEGAAFQSLAKSTYLALAVYQSLRARLPEHAVHLQSYQIDALPESDAVPKRGEPAPGDLRVDEAHGLPPAAVYVDVFAYVDPYWSMGFPAGSQVTTSTYGNAFAPLLAVRTSPAARPATHGALAISTDLLHYAHAPPSNAGSSLGLHATIADFLNGTSGVPPDNPQLDPSRLNANLPLNSSNLLVLPRAEFELDEVAFAEQVGAERIDLAPLQPMLDQIDAVVLASLAAVDYETATRIDRARYIAEYDRRLARRWLANAELTDVEEAKLALIRRFESEEWKFLERKDEDLVERAFYGPWGVMMRETLVAEQKTKDEFVSARDRAKAMQAMGAMAMGMSAMSAASVAASPMQAMSSSMTSMMQMSIMQMQGQMELNESLREITAAFENHRRATLNEPQRVFLQVLGQNEEVEAESLLDLRAKFRALYLTKTAGL